MHSYERKKKRKKEKTQSCFPHIVQHTKHIDILFLRGNGLSFPDNVEPLILPTSVFHFPKPKGTSNQIRGSLPQVPTMVPWRNMLPPLMSAQHTSRVRHKLKTTLNSEKEYTSQFFLRKPEKWETVGTFYMWKLYHSPKHIWEFLLFEMPKAG